MPAGWPPPKLGPILAAIMANLFGPAIHGVDVDVRSESYCMRPVATRVEAAPNVDARKRCSSRCAVSVVRGRRSSQVRQGRERMFERIANESKIAKKM